MARFVQIDPQSESSEVKKLIQSSLKGGRIEPILLCKEWAFCKQLFSSRTLDFYKRICLKNGNFVFQKSLVEPLLNRTGPPNNHRLCPFCPAGEVGPTVTIVLKGSPCRNPESCKLTMPPSLTPFKNPKTQRVSRHGGFAKIHGEVGSAKLGFLPPI